MPTNRDAFAAFVVLAVVTCLCCSTTASAQALNPRLADLPANQWVAIHQQAPGHAVRFKRQEHGGSCSDSKRCRIVLFGSNTHGQD